jgi:peptidyl-prolyl cis-trans isomerase D
MFDLFRSRAKAVRIMLGAMLTMVALSMLVYLIPGAGMPVGSADDQVVAEIGKEAVTVPEVDQQIRNVLGNRQLPADLMASYIPQIVDQAISDRAVAYEAQQLGFQVTDQELAKTLRSLQFGNLPPDQYRQYVEQQMGMSVQDFENNVRLKNYQDAIQMVALEGIIVTPAEVEAQYHKQNDKLKLDYIAFDPTKLAADVKPSAEDLKAYFDKNRNLFVVPEARDVQLVIADQAKVAASIQVSDAQIQNYYNSHKDQYRTPERVHARHILLSTTNKPKDEIPKIQAKAEDLLKQIRAGADFAKLAEKNSDDPGSASKGGDLGWVVRGQMVKNFEDTVFSLKPKEVSNVVTTEYGFHIIQVLEKEPARLQPLDEVKDQIAATLRNQTVFDRMQNLTDQAHAELLKSPKDAQQIAQKLGLLFVTADKFSQGGTLPELGADAQTGAAIMSLKPGEVSQELQSGNKLAIAEVTAIYAAHPAEMSEVEAKVRKAYTENHAMDLAAEKSKKAADLLKQNGGDLKAAAKSVGMDVKTSDFFTRSGAIEGVGSASALGDVFDKPVGTIIGPIATGAGPTLLGKIVARQDADMSKLAQDRDSIVTQLKGQKAQQRVLLFQDSVLSALIRQGKIKKHQDVINRLIARYRT